MNDTNFSSIRTVVFTPPNLALVSSIESSYKGFFLECGGGLANCKVNGIESVFAAWKETSDHRSCKNMNIEELVSFSTKLVFYSQDKDTADLLSLSDSQVTSIITNLKKMHPSMV
jgi:hypothetical protein